MKTISEYYLEAINQASRDFNVNDEIYSLMAQYLAPDPKRIEIIKERPIECVSPSDISKCMRKLYFAYMNEPYEKVSYPDKTWLKFQIGNLHHALVQAHVKWAVDQEGKYECWIEEFIDKSPFRGFADIVLATLQGKPFFVCDIKSVPNYVCKGLREPFLGAKMQTYCYMKGLNIQKGSILYVDTETGLPLEFESDKWLKETSARVDQRVQFLKGAVRMRMIPKADKRKWVCEHCPYPTLCAEVEQVTG